MLNSDTPNTERCGFIIKPHLIPMLRVPVTRGDRTYELQVVVPLSWLNQLPLPSLPTLGHNYRDRYDPQKEMQERIMKTWRAQMEHRLAVATQAERQDKKNLKAQRNANRKLGKKRFVS